MTSSALASVALTPDHFDAFPLDLADADAPARAAEQIAERWGALDVLVNNAAIMTGDRSLSTMSRPARWSARWR
ncbi:MAG TPA: SDR family NAD(P)-dependent oxidoreductase [Polyangia bacterium]|jgi:NAD(P)-dependent dehydrogenase (short-subunit alcohol dehydrogenase family)|nr:SDR family NAD(P)-dependent oxidoreductase [Polyangia bacterium]